MTGEEYLEESDHFESEATREDLPLALGVVGRHIVAYFQEHEDAVAVGAKSLGGEHSKDQSSYEITFEDGRVQKYLITFVGGYDFKTCFVLLNAEPLD